MNLAIFASLLAGLSLSLLGVGCGASIRSAAKPTFISSLTEVKVDPLYEASPNWNDFVRATDSVACVASDLGCVNGGAFRKVDLAIELPGCDGLTLEDALGAFDWVCRFDQGRFRFIGSLKDAVSLADLIDASETIPTFRKNSVRLSYQGTIVGSNSETAWWSNPITGITPRVGETQLLDTPSEIYVVMKSGTTDGIHIGADRISLVIPPGVTLTGTARLNYSYPSMATLNPNQSAVIAIDGRSFVSVEGSAEWSGGGTKTTDVSISGNDVTMNAVVFANSNYLRLKRLHLSSTAQHMVLPVNGYGWKLDRLNLGFTKAYDGIRNSGGTSPEFTHLNIHHTSRTGLVSIGTTGALYKDLYFEDCLHGFATGSAVNSVNENITAVRVTSVGISAMGAVNSTFRGMNAEKSGYGFYLYGTTTENKISAVKVESSAYAGIIIEGTLNRNTFEGLSVANSGLNGAEEGDGLEEDATAGSGNIYSNVVSSNNRGNGISLRTSGVVLSGALSVQNGRDGILLSGTVKAVSRITTARNLGHGLMRATADTGTIYHQILSLDNAGDGIRFAGEVAGSTLSQIAIGHNGGFGLYLGDSGSSRLKLMNQFFVAANTAGGCRVPSVGVEGIGGSGCTPTHSSTARIHNPIAIDGALLGTLEASVDTRKESRFIEHWTNPTYETRVWGKDRGGRGNCTAGEFCQVSDFGVWRSDSVLRNRTEYGDTANENFRVEGCPSAVNGDRLGVSYGGDIRFLSNAVEDSASSGNRNGLCEEGESCLYTPNFGFDQGELPRSRCEYKSAGGLSGVTIYGSLENGRNF